MNQRGFTLVEVIVVLVMLGILLMIAAPSMVSWQRNAGFQEVAREVLSSLREGRSMAIAENQQIELTIDIANHQIVYENAASGAVIKTKDLRENVDLQTRVDANDDGIFDNDDDPWTTNDLSVTFNSNGTCSDLLEIRVNTDDELVIGIASTAAGLARLP